MQNNMYRVTGTYIALHQTTVSPTPESTSGKATKSWTQRIPVDEIVVYPDMNEALNIACRRVATQSIDLNTFVADDVEELTVQPATDAEIEAHESHVALMQMAASAEPLFDLDQWGKLIQTAPQGATDAQLATIAEALAQVPPKFDTGDLIMMTVDEIITTRMLQALTEAEIATIMGALSHAAAHVAANAE